MIAVLLQGWLSDDCVTGWGGLVKDVLLRGAAYKINCVIAWGCLVIAVLLQGVA